MLKPFLKHLSKFHRNGKEQETQVPGEVYPTEDIQPIEVVKQAEPTEGGESAGNSSKVFLDDKSWDVQDVPPPYFQLGDIEKIEELVKDYAGIEEARVSFKTSNNDGTRHLQIRVRPNSKMRSRQYLKFKERVIRDVVLRIPPEIAIEVSRLKRIPQNDSNDPSS